jgi:hypothetical protein
LAIDVYEYFQRALRYHHHRCLIAPEQLVRWCDGNVAGFKLATEGGFIRRAAYRSTTCATLVGLCEHLSEMLPGMQLECARGIEAGELLRFHPEIPARRHDRAELCIHALRAAIQVEVIRRS